MQRFGGTILFILMATIKYLKALYEFSGESQQNNMIVLGYMTSYCIRSKLSHGDVTDLCTFRDNT